MKNSNPLLIATIIVLVAACCILSMLLISEKAAKESLKKEIAEVALKAKTDSESARRTEMASEIASRLADSKLESQMAVAGIYRYSKPNTGKTQVIDVRSDGSVLTYFYYGHNRNLIEGKKMTSWEASKGNVLISELSMEFKQEGEDLIDKAGNRWQRQ